MRVVDRCNRGVDLVYRDLSCLIDSWDFVEFIIDVFREDSLIEGLKWIEIEVDTTGQPAPMTTWLNRKGFDPSNDG